MPGRKWTTSDIAELKKLCGSASSRDIAAKLKGLIYLTPLEACAIMVV